MASDDYKNFEYEIRCGEIRPLFRVLARDAELDAELSKIKTGSDEDLQLVESFIPSPRLKSRDNREEKYCWKRFNIFCSGKELSVVRENILKFSQVPEELEKLLNPLISEGFDYDFKLGKGKSVCVLKRIDPDKFKRTFKLDLGQLILQVTRVRNYLDYQCKDDDEKIKQLDEMFEKIKANRKRLAEELLRDGDIDFEELKRVLNLPVELDGMIPGDLPVEVELDRPIFPVVYRWKWNQMS